MYKVLCKDGMAKRARLETVHGTVETPVFMNVGTIGAIKGAVSTRDLEEIHTQIMLCNTYHLHVRPGDDVVYDMGGIRKFAVWDKPGADRFRWISGVFPCRTAQDQGRGRLFQLSY